MAITDKNDSPNAQTTLGEAVDCLAALMEKHDRQAQAQANGHSQTL